MKRIVLFLLLCISFVCAKADGFRFLVLETKDGTKINVALDGVRIIFSGDVLNLVSGDDAWTYDTDKVSRFYFVEEEETEIRNVFTESADGTAVYDITGKFVGRFKSHKDMENSLPRGIYILRSHDEVFKRIVGKP